MSGILLGIQSTLGQVTGEVVVTGPLQSEFENLGALCVSGWRFGSDGGLDEIGPSGTTYTPTSGEWWSNEPASGIGAGYDIRCASINGGSWDTEAAATGVWVDMSVSRTWSVRVIAMNAPDTASCNGNFEIRINGGATLATFTAAAVASN